MRSNPRPTPYEALNAVLAALVSGIQAALGENFLGAYLQGSFAVGDFDEDSDVDFLIVTGRALNGEEVIALQALHARIYGLESTWAQHLEGSYFSEEILRSQTRLGEKLWYLDNGSQKLVESTHCNNLVVRWQLWNHGVILAGPPPQTLVEPVAAEALRREIRAVMTDWGREILDHPERFNNRFYQGFIVLSYCRMLHSLECGRIESKRAGAAWAKANLDPAWADLIDRTWATRPAPEVSVRTLADPQDFERTLAFVREAIQSGKGWIGR
jgi:hypothetical protein